MGSRKPKIEKSVNRGGKWSDEDIKTVLTKVREDRKNGNMKTDWVTLGNPLGRSPRACKTVWQRYNKHLRFAQAI